MKVWFGKNSRGQWKASADYEKIKKFEHLYEGEVPVIHNNTLYLTQSYYGYDYGLERIYDKISTETEVFHSVHSLKKNSKMWNSSLEIAQKDPENYHIKNFSIACDDCGEEFIYGDSMMGLWRTDIVAIKVIY